VTSWRSPLPPAMRKLNGLSSWPRGHFGDFPRRAIINTLNDAGYAIAIVQEAHRAEGWSE